MGTNIPNRQFIRLPGYDYSQSGAYFVTIVTQERRCLFGDITDRAMNLNDAGRMVRRIWDEMPVHYAGVSVDVFVAMPNHVHGIIILTNENQTPVGAGPRACPDSRAPSRHGRPQGAAPTRMALPDVVHRFKSMTTHEYIRGVKHDNWPPFARRLWQRNYHEHVIRNEDDLFNTRRYIEGNPASWSTDAEHVGVLAVGIA